MTKRSELGDLETLLGELEDRVGDAKTEADATGTPAERKIAAALDKQAETMEGLHQELMELHAAIDRASSMASEIEASGRRAADEVKSEAKNAADDYMRDYGMMLDHLERRSREAGTKIDAVSDDIDKAGRDAVHAIDQASIRASQEIGKAGKDVGQVMRRRGQASSLAFAFMVIVGGALSGIGVFLLFQVNPAVAKFVKANGAVAFFVLVAVIALLIFALYQIVKGNRGKRRRL